MKTSEVQIGTVYETTVYFGGKPETVRVRVTDKRMHSGNVNANGVGSTNFGVVDAVTGQPVMRLLRDGGTIPLVEVNARSLRPAN